MVVIDIDFTFQLVIKIKRSKKTLIFHLDHPQIPFHFTNDLRCNLLCYFFHAEHLCIGNNNYY